MPKIAIKKVAIYIRVSTVHQVDKFSLPMQRRDLSTYSELILGIPDYEIFEDAGYSGGNTDRPAYQNMMTRIRKGEFSHLLVWKLDRISRNLLDFAAMYEELQRLGVAFVSKTEQFDTSTAMGVAMMQIIMVFATLERRTTAERVTATMLSRAHSGQWNGGRVPYGYNYDADTKTFSINEDEAKNCRTIFNTYLKEKSIVVVTQYMNSLGAKTRNGIDWTPGTVWKILSNPFYAGIYRYNRYSGTKNRIINDKNEWILVKNHHPAIITQDAYEQAATTLLENGTQRNTLGRLHHAKQPYVFRDLIYCGLCKTRMVASPGNKNAHGARIPIYTCPLRRTSSCDNQSTNEYAIGEFVLNYIINMLWAKKEFSSIKSPTELEKRLLRGSSFCKIAYIEPDGLNDFYNLLTHYKRGSSFIFTASKPRKKKGPENSEVAALRKEQEQQERALSRLQNLYLYDESAISEKDFILRKHDIMAKLDEINRKLGMMNTAAVATLSDSDFVAKASYLLISKELQSKKYIYYRDFAESVSPDVLKTYMRSIIDSIFLVYGHVTAITFKNGLTHRFAYSAPLSPRFSHKSGYNLDKQKQAEQENHQNTE